MDLWLPCLEVMHWHILLCLVAAHLLGVLTVFTNIASIKTTTAHSKGREYQESLIVLMSFFVQYACYPSLTLKKPSYCTALYE